MMSRDYYRKLAGVGCCLAVALCTTSVLAAKPLKKATKPPGATAIRLVNLPVDIVVPGSFYLAENINFTSLDTDAITISASNVSIDLNGYTLSGPGNAAGSAGNGIAAGDVANIRVTNGVVTNWRGNGVDLEDAKRTQVDDVRADNNGLVGIGVGDTSTVKNCIGSHNGTDGIRVSSSVVTDCAAGNNGDNGIESGGASTVVNCTSNYNSSDGIFGNSRTIIKDCQVAQNGDNGIQVTGQCLVSGNNCSVNTGAGIRAVDSRSRIEGNTMAFNDIGLQVIGPLNFVIRNSASGNFSTQFSIGPGNTAGTIVNSEAALNAAVNSNVNVEF